MQLCYSCMHQINDKNLTTCPACGEPLDLSCDTTRFLKPGTVLQGKFIVGKILGAGGFGNTYIGWNKLLQCKVAIKEYFPRQLSYRTEENSTVSVSEATNQERFRAGLNQFLAEARGVAGLQNIKGIIQIYTFFEEYGTGYFVMEYLEGMDVKEILKLRGGRMDYENSRRIILTVLHTLREIHQRGVLHRDIAPDNIYVTKDGVIKLIDFGAAKHASEIAGAQGDIMLKPGYAPPEQYKRNSQQGAYTDLYAVAAMFYRLLTGKKPQSANERLKADQLRTLSDMGISLPKQAEYAILMCLSLEPQRRLQSAQDFMEALDGTNFVPVYEPEWILPKIEEQPETFFGRITHKIRKMNPIAKVGLLLLLLTFLAGVVIGGIYLHSSITQKEIFSQGIDSLPQCVGESEENALKILKQASAQNIEVIYRYDANQSVPIVVNMEPPNGSSLKAGEVVTLYVANTERITLPDYHGKKKEEIEKSLREILGGKYDEIKDKLYQYGYWEQKKGSCHSQSVDNGELSIGDLSDLSIQLSWGKESDYIVSMPDICGKTVAEAKQTLNSLGLKLQIDITKKDYSNVYENGKIIWQSLLPDYKINNNVEDAIKYTGDKKIHVTISKGAKPKPKATAKPKTKNNNEKSSNDFNASKSTTEKKKPSNKKNDFNANTSGSGDDW